MSAVKTVSQAGLARVFGHEGVVPGIYNCPANHATFGIGSLIHKGPSKILGALKAAKATGKPKTDPDLTAYIRLYKQTKTSRAVEYVSVEIREDKHYKPFIESLSAGIGASKDILAKESHYLAQGWEAYLKAFRKAIQQYEEGVRNAFPDIALTQDQFDGFFSITYNIGPQGLLKSKGLISAMKTYVKASARTKDSAASALLDQILRTCPTAPSAVSGSVDNVSFKLTESRVFNGGLFSRRVAEASLILGHKYSEKDQEIRIARKTIKGEKDHATTEATRQQVRTVLKALNAIGRINRGGI